MCDPIFLLNVPVYLGFFFNEPKSQFPVAKLPSLGKCVMGSVEGQIISNLSPRPYTLFKHLHK